MKGNSEKDNLLNDLLRDGPVTIIPKQDGQFVLEVVNDSKVESSLTYAAGTLQSILATLKHEPAEAVELEAAITVIEDQLMPVIKNLPERRCLVTSEQAFWKIAEVAGFGLEDKLQLDVDTVEEIFNRLVDVGYGTPASMLDVPESREFTVAVLFLRELMHHANYKVIYLSN